MPSVSVVIPFRDRIPWLLEAVESVLGQTYRDLELIVVNDGSTTPFDPACLGHDPRLRYLEQENRGPAAARNVGIAHSRGEFIAFLDADDLFLPDKLRTQVECLAANPEASLCHTSYRRLRADGSPLDVVDSGSFDGMVYPRIVAGCPIATPTVMLRRAALGELRFDERLRSGEDVLLWIRLARRGPFAGIRDPLSSVRIHGRNAADDPARQLTANMAIIDAAVGEDPSFGPEARSRLRAEVHWNVALLHARRGAWLAAAGSCLRAAPEHVRGYGWLSLVGRMAATLRRRASHGVTRVS